MGDLNFEIGNKKTEKDNNKNLNFGNQELKTKKTKAKKNEIVNKGKKQIEIKLEVVLINNKFRLEYDLNFNQYMILQLIQDTFLSDETYRSFSGNKTYRKKMIDNKEFVRLSKKEIAKKLHISIDSVKRGIKDLVKKDILEKKLKQERFFAKGERYNDYFCIGEIIKENEK